MTLPARTFGTTAGVTEGASEERAAQHLVQVGEASHEFVPGGAFAFAVITTDDT
jgi:hypothetical protein